MTLRSTIDFKDKHRLKLGIDISGIYVIIPMIYFFKVSIKDIKKKREGVKKRDGGRETLFKYTYKIFCEYNI